MSRTYYVLSPFVLLSSAARFRFLFFLFFNKRLYRRRNNTTTVACALHLDTVTPPALTLTGIDQQKMIGQEEPESERETGGETDRETDRHQNQQASLRQTTSIRKIPTRHYYSSTINQSFPRQYPSARFRSSVLTSTITTIPSPPSTINIVSSSLF